MFASVLITALLVAVPEGSSPRPGLEEARIDRAKAAFVLAERAFEEGRFEAALDGYRKAHTLSGRPELLFNIGQSQRSLGQWEPAILSFERYLAAYPAAPDELSVRALITELEAKAHGASAASGGKELYEEWWFWAATGAAVVAAGAAAVAGASRSDPTGDLATFDLR